MLTAPTQANRKIAAALLSSQPFNCWAKVFSRSANRTPSNPPANAQMSKNRYGGAIRNAA